MLKKTAVQKISDLAAQLMQKGTLIAPVREDAGFNFREISDAGQVDLNFYNTLMSPKSAFFPHMEDFVRYQTGKSVLDAVPVEISIKPAFLFGVRPVDPYWQKRREATTIFGYAFDLNTPADGADFYATLGIGAADPEGSDVFMMKKGDELLLKAVTKKGEKLLAEMSGLTDWPVF